MIVSEERAEEAESSVVITAVDSESVELSVSDRDGDYATVELTPTQAREVATRLMQASIVADPEWKNPVPSWNPS